MLNVNEAGRAHKNAAAQLLPPSFATSAAASLKRAKGLVLAEHACGLERWWLGEQGSLGVLQSRTVCLPPCSVHKIGGKLPLHLQVYSVENGTPLFEQSVATGRTRAALEEEHHSSCPWSRMRFVCKIVRVCPGG